VTAKQRSTRRLLAEAVLKAAEQHMVNAGGEEKLTASLLSDTLVVTANGRLARQVAKYLTSIGHKPARVVLGDRGEVRNLPPEHEVGG